MFSFVTFGGTAKVALRYGDLKTNTTYAFRTSAYDGGLYETDWSAWAKFKTRGRTVDIKLPEPNKSAPAVDLDKYQEPMVGRRNLPKDLTRAAKDAGKGSETCTDHGQKITCIEVGKPSDLSAKQKQDVANKLRASSGDLVPWCNDAGVSLGEDYQQTMKRALARTRAPVERGVARLRSWRIFRHARCSPNRMTSIAKSVLALERHR
ncbi:hypothetical protein GCM10010341_81540 [Streptomyces noursei]|nr:hypothetical protein GCM10010341_81540 [Streptomyces noursei]